MSELPPADEVVDALKLAVAPSGAAAAGAFGGLLLVAWLAGRAAGFDWRRAAPPAAVLALAAGLAAGNHFRPAFPWAADGKWWHWAWPAIGLVLAAELVARLPAVGVGVGHLLRGVAAGVAAATAVPADWQAEARWVMPAAAAAAGAQWAVVDAVGRRAPGGAVPAAVAAGWWGAVGVLLHHKALGFADAATFGMTATGAVAVLAWATRTDGGAAAAAGTVPVAVLLLLGRALGDSPIPRAGFLLAAFAPLTLGVFLLPGVRRYNTYRAATPVKLGLVLVPAAAAVYLAMSAAPMTFGDEW